MATEKQKLACERNWNKAQLVNIFYRLQHMKRHPAANALQQARLYQASTLVKDVLREWDTPEKQRELQKKRKFRMPWEVGHTGTYDDWLLEEGEEEHK